MPKLKTRKAASKRYKITGNNNFLRRHAFKGHLLMKKSNKQKRKLSQNILVNYKDIKVIKLMLPY
jgi:large subunit ribosomal protein L35